MLPAKRFTFPWYTWLGLAILVGAESMLAGGVRLVAVWFTPIVWTGYILLADGIVSRLRGASWLTSRRREFPLLVLTSVAVWLLFEAYNLHLKNWVYVGVPSSPLLRDLAYFWAFATIMPGVFESAALVEALLPRRSKLATDPPVDGRLGPGWLWFLAGVAMVTIPLLLPERTAAYLFAPVWMGFIFVLEPINERLAAPSLRARWRAGDRRPVRALLIGGLLCGFLWEAWNYQAFLTDGGHWIYTIPQALRPFGLHYGKMPVLGLGGFPPFALELYAFYAFARQMLGGDRIFGALSS